MISLRKKKKVVTRNQIMAVLAEHDRKIHEFGVRRLAVFGSAARDEMNEGSDIDILVDFRKKTFDNYIGLKFYLEKILGRKIDLVTRSALRKEMKPQIYRDLFYVQKA